MQKRQRRETQGDDAKTSVRLVVVMLHCLGGVMVSAEHLEWREGIGRAPTDAQGGQQGGRRGEAGWQTVVMVRTAAQVGLLTGKVLRLKLGTSTQHWCMEQCFGQTTMELLNKHNLPAEHVWRVVADESSQEWSEPLARTTTCRKAAKVEDQRLHWHATKLEDTKHHIASFGHEWEQR